VLWYDTNPSENLAAPSLKMEAAKSSEKLISYSKITRRNKPENIDLNTDLVTAFRPRTNIGARQCIGGGRTEQKRKEKKQDEEDKQEKRMKSIRKKTYEGN
jgi:hypothetical protein